MRFSFSLKLHYIIFFFLFSHFISFLLHTLSTSNYYQPPLELKKKLEEVRLLESRRSARLVDQNKDTDFARLADMAGDRRARAASNNIDVPMQFTQHG
jgi:hypothetical protein